MSNKDKYKKAFSVLQTSEQFSLEVEKMDILNKKRKLKTIGSAVAACLFLIIGSGTAYATNLGGIQRTLQLWIHGDQTEVTVDFSSDGTYNMEYIDENGNICGGSGGGVTIDSDGNERPLTEEELKEHIISSHALDIRYPPDGTVILYFYDQVIDITDKFNDDGVCYIKLEHDGETTYVTARYQDGWITDPEKYVDPDSFSTKPND